MDTRDKRAAALLQGILPAADLSIDSGDRGQVCRAYRLYTVLPTVTIAQALWATVSLQAALDATMRFNAALDASLETTGALDGDVTLRGIV